MMSQDGSGQMEPSRFGQIIGMNPKASGALQYGGAGFSLAYAASLISTGQCRMVACVYATNQRSSGYQFATPKDPYTSPYGFLNAAGFAAMGFQRYLTKYGLEASADKLGAIAITQRKNASLNPIAYRRNAMSWDDYLQDRWIVWPLRRSDVCVISDGGVCVILAEAEFARDLSQKPVFLRSSGRQDGLRMMENEDHLLVPHMRSTADQLHQRSGIRPKDIDALYVQDAHSPAVLLALENYGFCGPGEALDFIQDGRISLGGELPLNSSGGQLSEGYMLGWLHHVELFHQLRGDCGERQIPGCRIAQFCGTGGFREFTCAAIYSSDPS
jgi:acetyl-CoA acetyltransferase